MTYDKLFNPAYTPQHEKIPGREDQTFNRAGGAVWEVDDLTKLERLLVLGSDGATYYASGRELTRSNGEAVLRLLEAGHGPEVVERARFISYEGKAHRNDPALFVLALCSAFGDETTKRASYDALPEVARTFDHLTKYLNFLESFGKRWSYGLRRGVNRIYAGRSMRANIYQMTKYPAHNGWTQRDVLLKAHVIDERGRMPEAITARSAAEAERKKGEHSTERGNVYRLGIGREAYPWSGDRSEDYEQAMEYAGAVQALRSATSTREMARLVREHRLPREVVPREAREEPAIWEALLPDMPITALFRNLSMLTRMGLTQPMSESTEHICSRLTDEQALHRGRVHPLTVLAALGGYGRGHSRNFSWKPERTILDALDAAFYKAFATVEPSGTRTLIGLDVSASMCAGEVSGIHYLTPRVASAALALVTVATEPRTHVVAFTGDGGGIMGRPAVEPLDISPRERLDDVVKRVDALPFGPTDCSLPLQYANAHGIPAESFMTLTDNETWRGNTMHPMQALWGYRRKMGLESRLATVAMVANEFSIADPRDPGAMDFVGFGSDTPAALATFFREEA